MAKQKVSIVGVIVVVGLVAFVLALGGGLFQNFAIESTDTTPTPTPTATASPAPSMQQIQNWLNQLWNEIKAFLQQLGITI